MYLFMLNNKYAGISKYILESEVIYKKNSQLFCDLVIKNFY